MKSRHAPELLSPAGSLDAVRAAVANGADAVYLGASRFNARDEGAQLTLDELEEACRIAHARGRRVYLTFNVLVKPAELVDALVYLGDCIDRGIDAAIVQDIGLVRLIQAIYPRLEIHGSTQMTVHDTAGAAVMRELGIERVVLARENTLDDVRAIRAAVPDLGLETFVHGALCISYSGQCYMSGMISERSANRGSCAQSCRKDYQLHDVATGDVLDSGYLISAKDLGAWEHLAEIADAGVGCLKIEGRKKKPEYVATVTKGYRDFLDRIERGEPVAPQPEEIQPLVQIYSRGFTGGMYGGREGREYITRTQPDNHGFALGSVVGYDRGELLVEVTTPIEPGDGLGFEPPAGAQGESTGFAVDKVRLVNRRGGTIRQAIGTRVRVPLGWRVLRTSHASLLERARASYASLPAQSKARKARVDVRLFGAAGTPLKAVFVADDETITVRSEVTLSPAQKRALDVAQLREQLGRLGDTPFVLGALDLVGLAEGMFLPVSELNHVRQQAVDELMTRRDWARQAKDAERLAAVEAAVAAVPVSAPVRLTREIAPIGGVSVTLDSAIVPNVDVGGGPPRSARGGLPMVADAHDSDARHADARDAAMGFGLVASVWRVEDALAAADAGATEVVFDPFLRHPAPPLARLRALGEELARRGVTLRLRTPTIVRPEERPSVDKYLALGLPVLSGHLGLVSELGRAGRDVVADYAVNCFNQHTAAEMFRLGAGRVVLSIELTADEMAQVAAPWKGEGFDVLVHGRTEGMTIEHCVLSAAFDREPTTCRDLCVKKHPNVTITDPAGYTFPVATDSACRNRLLHSRPIDGAEYLPRLWSAGLRRFHLVFNVPGDPVAEVVSRYREALEELAAGRKADARRVREPLGQEFTRGHFARAV